MFIGKKFIFYISAFVTLLSSCSGDKKSQDNISIYAAASMRDVVEDLIADYEKEFNVDVKLNFASSGTLARQIEQGADADIYISANLKWMEYLSQSSLLKDSSICNIAENTLVLVSNKESGKDFSDSDIKSVLSEGKIAIGNPVHVPAGMYAAQAIEKYISVKDIPKNYLKTKDVRSALMLAELNEVDWAIVYKTDAMRSEKVRIVFEFPAELHEAINYKMAMCSDSKIAKDLYLYIKSEKADRFFEKYSFIR